MDPADQPHQPDPGAGGADRAEQVRDQGSGQRLAARLFRFSQLEFPWALGPPDGRYVLRDAAGEASHVVVLTTLGAVERRRLRRRGRARKVDPEPEPAPVATARATVIDTATTLGDPAEATRWLRRAGEEELTEGVGVLNDVLHAYGVVAADPRVHPVSRAQALVARVGFGDGEQVADGRWTEARELVARDRRQRRLAALAPQERLAAVLGRHEQPLVSEELALRARLDLDHGRARAAALQLRVALDAAVAELADDPGLAQRVDELRDWQEAIAGAAETALTVPLSEEEHEAVAYALGRIEAAFRARTAARPTGR